MIEDRYLRFYYENYFLDYRYNWGYLYTISCMAYKEKIESEAAEESCETKTSKAELFTAGSVSEKFACKKAISEPED